MSRLAGCFAELKAQGKKGLVIYIVAGDPQPSITLPLMHRLVEAGTDIIELGIPFSDPMAEGPVIQKAHERALVHGIGLKDILQLVAEFRQTNTTTPVVLMGYLNPIETMGYANFAKAAHAAGVDGVLTVDLPPDEFAEVLPLFREQALDPIFLVAPTTPEYRMKSVAEAGSGFCYYVSLKGVTGAGSLDTQAVAERIAQLRKQTGMPLAVGFGIKDAESAAAIGQVADAVVVGSAVVAKMEATPNDQKAIMDNISDLVSSIRQALDTK